AAMAEEADFAEFVIADDRSEPGIESLSEFAQAFLDASEGGFIADAERCAAAGVIAVGDHKVRFWSFGKEPIEEIRLAERIVEPDVTAVETNEESGERILDATQFVTIAQRLLGCRGVMDVAYYGKAKRQSGGNLLRNFKFEIERNPSDDR